MPSTKKSKRSSKRSAYAQQLARSRQRPVAPARLVFDSWEDPKDFAEALALHMRRHEESAHKLWRAIIKSGDDLDPATIVTWRNGSNAPRSAKSFVYLNRIEDRYGLSEGYFQAKLPHPARAATRKTMSRLKPSEQRRLAWHLPNDFETRSRANQDEILTWVNDKVITGATEYRRYQAAAMKHPYAIRFPDFAIDESNSGDDENTHDHVDPDTRATVRDAPPHLAQEMRELLRFKTATLSPTGYVRRGVWGPETAAQKVEHLGLMLGALTAAPNGPVRGRGIGIEQLRLALLAMPQIWDWYVEWRERRRGFYTAWEIDMLSVANALTSPETGWLTQSPALASGLEPIPGMVSESDIAEAQTNWTALCARTHVHAMRRAKEIQRVVRVHRDPFEPILPVLEAPSPVAEYRKIADEIIRLMPRRTLYPRAAAECLRSLLMIRLGLHLGLRQKNLRQLLVARRGAEASTERQLSDRKCGELRWSDRDNGWEVFIPAVAFKNANSSFFSGQPFRLVLPDLCGLYEHIERYLARDRALLVGNAEDPGTFFVKSVKLSSTSAAYNQTTFYEAWRLTIQRYGVYNPYTNRGAIKGLLPHGPHNVRDVLATHILKQTGSFEQASYAIQDTPDIVAKHYGRFLPENKASLAAAILNRVWQEG